MGDRNKSECRHLGKSLQSPGDTVHFYPGNDANETPVIRTVVSGQKVGSTDLWVGILDSWLPSSISHYEFGDVPLSGTPPDGVNLFIEDAGIYQDLDAYVFGRSPVNQSGFRDQAVGRNRISGYSENVPFLGNSNNDSLIMFNNSPGDADYVQYEALVQGGDSGGPMFVDINGSLVLLGTNAFLLDGNVAFGINYTGNQAGFLNSYIANAVPEPSGLAALVVVGFIFTARRRSSPEC